MSVDMTNLDVNGLRKIGFYHFLNQSANDGPFFWRKLFFEHSDDIVETLHARQRYLLVILVFRKIQSIKYFWLSMSDYWLSKCDFGWRTYLEKYTN